MATPTVNDLDGLLSSLNQLKPPGASKNKIAAITTLCVNNIQVESNIVQSFYRALKKAPATHKLGALYVIDSVVRQWIEKARASGQELQLEGRGEPGTYSAAVKRVTELMPALFDDIMKGIPADQKPKLDNMITIWERGNTFPAKLLAEFKSKVSGAPSQPAPVPVKNGAPAYPGQPPVSQTTTASGEKFMAPVPSRPIQTPVGYPPAHLYDHGFLPPRAPAPHVNGSHSMPSQSNPMQAPVAVPVPAQSQMPAQGSAPAADVNSILAALSKAAVAQPPPQSVPPVAQQAPSALAPAPQSLPQGLPPQLAALFAQQSVAQPPPAQQPQQAPQFPYSAPSAPPMPAFPPPPPQFAAFPPQPPPSIPQAYAIAPPPQQYQPLPPADPLAQLRGFLPENILNDREKLIPALQLLQDLQKDGIPAEKWGPVLQAFEQQYRPQSQQQAQEPAYGGRRDRDRSRSPDRGGRGGGGRGSPVYGAYDASSRNQPEESRDPRGGYQRNRYRQRSPIRADSPSSTAMNGRPMQPKVIGYDETLPPDYIKVLSRTLFVGGANGTQQEIQELFERFGRVQTCIANRDKRHAFVKMTTRQHALAAKQAMEDMQTRNERDVMNIARQTKWGVGFGPRECCDYQRGESVIPIHKLTEADMKWLLTAEYGGTGGQKVQGGMVLEEPDIEIGAGVSSKAMSKRVGPDNSAHAQNAGGNNRRSRDDQREGGGGGGGGGHRGGRHGKHHHGKDRDRDQTGGGYGGGGYGSNGGPPLAGMDPYGYAPRPEPVAVATPPAVPGFGFNLGLPTSGAQNTYR